MEPLTPLDELKDLRFAVSALAELGAEPGSYKGEVLKNAARGIRGRLDWVIRTLEAANEGSKNMGVQ